MLVGTLIPLSLYPTFTFQARTEAMMFTSVYGCEMNAKNRMKEGRNVAGHYWLMSDSLMHDRV